MPDQWPSATLSARLQLERERATTQVLEALGLADTIVAFYRGRQVATFTRESRSEEEVVAAITGQRIERGTA